MVLKVYDSFCKNHFAQSHYFQMIPVIAKNANTVIIISHITLLNCSGKFIRVTKLPNMNWKDIYYYF